MDNAADVLLERIGAVGHIKLNRPDAINAINASIRTHLPRMLDELDRDENIRVILLSGAGERGFSVGADIKEMRASEGPIDGRARLIRDAWIESIDRVSKPVIAAIHGFCLGGGLEVALACDIRIASPSATFGLPEVNLGLIPGGGGTQRLPRIVGLGAALDLLMTGDRINAAEAHRISLVSRLSREPSTLLEEAFALAERLAAKPPSALAFVKEAARSGIETDLAGGLRVEKNLFAILLSTEDRKEAAAAFREKRSAVFSGR